MAKRSKGDANMKPGQPSNIPDAAETADPNQPVQQPGEAPYNPPAGTTPDVPVHVEGTRMEIPTSDPDIREVLETPKDVDHKNPLDEEQIVVRVKPHAPRFTLQDEQVGPGDERTVGLSIAVLASRYVDEVLPDGQTRGVSRARLAKQESVDARRAALTRKREQLVYQLAQVDEDLKRLEPAPADAPIVDVPAVDVPAQPVEPGNPAQPTATPLQTNQQ